MNSVQTTNSQAPVAVAEGLKEYPAGTILNFTEEEKQELQLLAQLQTAKKTELQALVTQAQVRLNQITQKYGICGENMGEWNLNLTTGTIVRTK